MCGSDEKHAIVVAMSCYRCYCCYVMLLICQTSSTVFLCPISEGVHTIKRSNFAFDYGLTTQKMEKSLKTFYSIPLAIFSKGS